MVIRRGKRSSPTEIAPHKKAERWPRGRGEVTRLIPLPPIPLPNLTQEACDRYTSNPRKFNFKPPQATEWQAVMPCQVLGV